MKYTKAYWIIAWVLLVVTGGIVAVSIWNVTSMPAVKCIISNISIMDKMCYTCTDGCHMRGIPCECTNFNFTCNVSYSYHGHSDVLATMCGDTYSGLSADCMKSFPLKANRTCYINRKTSTPINLVGPVEGYFGILISGLVFITVAAVMIYYFRRKKTTFML